VHMIYQNKQDQGIKGKFYTTALCAQNVEGIRSAYVDEVERKLYATVGDRCVICWDLQNLKPKIDDDSTAESHSHGSCGNSYVLQHRNRILLLFAGSVSGFSMDFDKMVKKMKKKKSELDPDVYEHRPEEEKFQLQLSPTTAPVYFDGTRVVLLLQESASVWSLEVLDWHNERRSIRKVKVEMNGLNALVPSNVCLSGDKLLCVVNDKTLTCWSVGTGAVLYRAKVGSPFVSMNVNVNSTEQHANGVTNTSKNGNEFVLVSLHKDAVIRVHKDGKLAASYKLNKSICRFDLGLCYMLQAHVDWERENKNTTYSVSKVVFNDDTGVHVAHIEN